MSCLRKIFAENQIIWDNLVYVKESRVIPWNSGTSTRQFVTLVDAQGYSCLGCFSDVYSGPVINPMDSIQITNGCISYSSCFLAWYNQQGIYIDDCVLKGKGPLCNENCIKPVYSVTPKPCPPVSCNILSDMMNYANDGGLLQVPVLQVVHKYTQPNTEILLHCLSDGRDMVSAKLEGNIPLYTTIRIHHWEKYPQNSIRVWDYELVGSERDSWYGDMQVITVFDKQTVQSKGVNKLVTPNCVEPIIKGVFCDQSPVVQVVAHGKYKEKCILLITDGKQYHGAVLPNALNTYVELPKKGDVIILKNFAMTRSGWWPTSQVICIYQYSTLTTSGSQLGCQLYSCLGQVGRWSQLSFGVLHKLCLGKHTDSISNSIILQCIGKNDSSYFFSDGEWFIRCDIEGEVNLFDFIQLNKCKITPDYYKYCWILTFENMKIIDCGVDIVTRRRYHSPIDINQKWNDHFSTLSGVDKTLRRHGLENETLKVRITRFTLAPKIAFIDVRTVLLDLIDSYGVQIGMEVLAVNPGKAKNIQVGNIIAIRGFNYNNYPEDFFSHLHDYPAHLTSNKETKLYILPEDKSFPVQKYTFVPLKQIPSRPTNALLDVCGVITSIGTDGSITIANRTTSVNVLIDGNQRNIVQNQIIIFKNARKLNACTLAFIKDITQVYNTKEAKENYLNKIAEREIEKLVQWQQADLPVIEVQPLSMLSRYVFVVFLQ